MIEVNEARFAEYRSAIDAADVAVASFKDETGSNQVVIVKGRRLVEAVARGRNTLTVNQCFVACRSKQEANRLLSIFKDW